MRIKFTKKEVIKFILKVYLPLLIIISLTSYINHGNKLETDFKSIILYLLVPLWFVYPVYLLVNLKIKKFLHWFFIGVVPYTIISYILIMKNEILNSIFLSLFLANIMYPLGLLGIKTFKEYLEMSKEMTWGRKIILWSTLILVIISVLKRARW